MFLINYIKCIWTLPGLRAISHFLEDCNNPKLNDSVTVHCPDSEHQQETTPRGVAPQGAPKMMNHLSFFEPEMFHKALTCQRYTLVQMNEENISFAILMFILWAEALQ